MGRHNLFVRRVLLIGLFAGPLTATQADALDPTRSIVQMSHRAYTRDDGLPGAVESIAQTPDGYLWIGTVSGLYRFDGVRFEHIAVPDQISSAIISLTVTASGDLWIGYISGGLSRLRDGTVVNYHEDLFGADFEAQTLQEIPNGGGLWAMSSGTPWRFDGRKWRMISGPWISPTNRRGGVWAMETDRKGTYWAKNGDGVFYCRPGCAQFIAAPGYAGGVMGFARDRDGHVWTSDTRAPGHMYALPDLTGASDAAIPGPAYGGQISQRIHGTILLDRDGTLWNISAKHGLLRARSILKGRADPNQVDAFEASDGLSADVVDTSYEDREGSIWVATNEGLDRFRPANVVLERQIPITASSFGYNALRAGGALFLYANTNEDDNSAQTAPRGPLYRENADGSTQLVVPQIAQPYAMSPAADGGLWIGTNRGLYKLKNGTLTVEPLPLDVQNTQDAQDVTVMGVVESAAGELWVSIPRHGLWRRVNGVWSQIIPMRADHFTSWGNMTFDTQGALWMADDLTVARYANGRLLEMSGPAGPNIGHIGTVRADRHGILFGGEFGLARYDGRAFHTLRSEHLPVLALVSGIVEANGQTWISSHTGILRFDTGALERAVAQPGAPAPDFKMFDRRDGVVGGFQDGPYSTSDSSAFLGPNGRIWFLTDRGVVWIDPHNIFRNALPPPVAIRSLTANGRSYASPHDLSLPAGASNLEIDYAALSFVEPSCVHFRYKLDGVDNDWVDPGDRRQVFYTQLGPGTYNFHVIASNDAGIWNRTGAAVTFSIAPTFVQSIWFKILVALPLAGLIWLTYTLRIRQETARLQNRFDIRIAERERIARELHDTLLQGFQGLVLRFQSIANRVPAGDALRAPIEDALTRADGVLAEGRARVRELRSSSETGDLAQSLAEAASNIIGGDTPNFHLTVEGEQRILNTMAGEEVLRTFEEAIRNVVQHANAKNIDALLTYGRKALLLSVRDDGAGMAASKLSDRDPSGHFGLVGMRERAERIGGRLEVTSREGGGTEVILSAPAQMAYKRRRLWPLDFRSAVQSAGSE